MTADASGPVRPEVVLLCGVAGAGKTTYALGLEALGYVRLSVDEEVWAANGRYGVDYLASDYTSQSLAAGRLLLERLVDLVEACADVVVDLSFWKSSNSAHHGSNR